MKKLLTYGVELTAIEEMKFKKFISNSGIAPNTMTEEGRKKLVENWKIGEDARDEGCDFCHDPHCAGSCQDDNDF